MGRPPVYRRGFTLWYIESIASTSTIHLILNRGSHIVVYLIFSLNITSKFRNIFSNVFKDNETLRILEQIFDIEQTAEETYLFEVTNLILSTFVLSG